MLHSLPDHLNLEREKQKNKILLTFRKLLPPTTSYQVEFLEYYCSCAEHNTWKKLFVGVNCSLYYCVVILVVLCLAAKMTTLIYFLARFSVRPMILLKTNIGVQRQLQFRSLFTLIHFALPMLSNNKKRSSETKLFHLHI